ncbi:MAG: tRNA (adenosine(37)-N6)-threonylcarbamoyltransferase complex ATPase subunit type 1 TsaE [Candidatus Colwellbacteria bacterium]|nr:tRNA (adenosine(37)-N6)-threonylcarbamoyltransferase complex ATPase subunit type 1 TsaE [Candidatus Colwellbacteria bacterium]
MKFISKSPKETMARARILAEKLSKASLKKPLIIGLTGDLGAGKTTFVKGFVRGFGVRKKIMSPTFIIMRKLRARDGRDIYHIDAYRVGGPKNSRNDERHVTFNRR